MKAIERCKGFKSEQPCNGLKDVDKLFEQCDKCKKQSDAADLQKSMDAIFKKANLELRSAAKRFEDSSMIPDDFPPLVKLLALEKSLLAEEKATDKRIDDLLEKLP